MSFCSWVLLDFLTNIHKILKNILNFSKPLNFLREFFIFGCIFCEATIKQSAMCLLLNKQEIHSAEISFHFKMLRNRNVFANLCKLTLSFRDPLKLLPTSQLKSLQFACNSIFFISAHIPHFNRYFPEFPCSARALQQQLHAASFKEKARAFGNPCDILNLLYNSLP